MSKPQVLVVTGMHRSGTSFLASVVQKGGVQIGEKLLGGNASNPRGHFEDMEFLALHEDALRRLRQTPLVQNASAIKGLSAGEKERARELVEARKDLALWGWKEPRTALFLDDWTELLPEARFLLVYRHPIDVTLSLLRRGIDLEVLADPLAGQQAWGVYNQAVLDFYRRNAERCVLCHIQGVAESLDPLLARLTEKLELPLATAGVDKLFHSSELARAELPQAVREIFRQLDPAAATLYEELEAAADLPDIYRPVPETPPGRKFPLLQEMVASFTRDSVVEEFATRPLFAMLVAAIDPEAAKSWIGSATSFAKKRRNLEDLQVHTSNLETRVRELGIHAENLEKRSEGLQAHTSNLEPRVEELEEHSRNLEAELVRVRAADSARMEEARRLRLELERTHEELHRLTTSPWVKTLRGLRLLR